MGKKHFPVFPYIPRSLLNRLANHPETVEPGFRERVWGVVSFCDISGFTPLSEALGKLGPEGAEILTRILNSIFGKFLEAIDNSGGEVVKFGGDAVTVIHRPIPGESQPQVALRAANLAAQLQDLVVRFGFFSTKAGDFTLAMKVGMSCGAIFHCIVGPKKGPWEAIFAGDCVDASSSSEHHASPGDIVLTPALAGLLPSGTIIWGEDGFGWLAPEELPRCPEFCLSAPPENLASLEKQAQNFLHPDLLEMVLAGVGLVGEIRPVTVMFLNFSGIDYSQDPEAADKLQILYSSLAQTLDRFGGNLSRMDMGDKGSKAVILFGAPKARENQEELAVRAGLAIQKMFAQLPFPASFRAGINKGTVFAGNVGSDLRREYTVMGDAVNLAARLMTAAQENSLLVEGSIREKIPAHLRGKSLDPIRVKGKSNAIKVFVPKEEKKRKGPTQIQSAEPVGREQENDFFSGLMGKAHAGQGHLVSLYAEGGMGKSMLAEHWQRMAQEQGFQVLLGACQAFTAHEPYTPWRAILRDLLGLDSLQPKLENLQTVLDSVLQDQSQWAPLFGDIFGSQLKESETTQSLSPKLRRERLFALVLELIQAKTQNKDNKSPLLLVAEDVHWADSASLELLEYVGRNIANWGIVFLVIHRPDKQFPQWESLEHSSRLPLSALDPKATGDLLARLLKVTEVPQDLIDAVQEKAQGNPFFLEEMVHILLEEKLLIIEDGQVKGDLQASAARVPGSVKELLLTRMDKLPSQTKNTLKVASCFGRTFERSALEGSYPENLPTESLEKDLVSLADLGLMLLDNKNSQEYSFRHILVQEVAYGTLLFSQRRKIHGNIGRYLETLPEEEVNASIALLAHHFDLAQLPDKAIPYLFKAGSQASSRYANNEAIKAFSRTLELLPECTLEDQESSRCKLQATLKLAQMQLVVGEWDEAEMGFSSSKELARFAKAEEVFTDSSAGLFSLFDNRNQYSKMLKAAGDLLEFGRDHNNSRAIREAQYQKGVAHHRKGELKKAELNLVDLIGNTQGEESNWRRSDTLTFLLSIYLEKDELDTAENYLQQLGLDLGENVPPELQLRIFIHKFDLFLARKEMSSAENCLEKGQILANKFGFKNYQANFYGRRAKYFLGKGDPKRAAQFFEKELEIYQELNASASIGITINNLGTTSYFLEDFSGALVYYFRAKSIFEKLSMPALEVLPHFNIGEVLQEMGKWREALEPLENARTLYLSLDNPMGALDAWALIYESYIQLGDLEKISLEKPKAIEFANQHSLTVPEKFH